VGKISKFKQLEQKHLDRKHIGLRCPDPNCNSFKIVRVDALDGFVSTKQERRLYRCLDCQKVFSIISSM